jgi:hypothetical protein
MQPADTGCEWLVTGCGRFFEGTAEEMHQSLNVTLAGLPDDTKVFVSAAIFFSLFLTLSCFPPSPLLLPNSLVP